jgi:hypothetical protein
VFGDFNVPAAAWIEDGDHLAAWPDPPEATYPASEPTEAIDYCVAGRDLVLEASVLGVGGRIIIGQSWSRHDCRSELGEHSWIWVSTYTRRPDRRT